MESELNFHILQYLESKLPNDTFCSVKNNLSVGELHTLNSKRVLSYEEQQRLRGLEESRFERLSKDPDQKLKNLLLDTEPVKPLPKSMALAKRDF